ncbi:MAG: TraB/GumN family protein [Pseudomonadota bacterium]
MYRFFRFVMSSLILAFGLIACSGEVDPRNAAEGLSQETSRNNQLDGPALWRVADADTTVFLFGTVHVLRPGLDWQSVAIEDAFNAADAVYFEADVDSPKALSDTNAAATALGLYTDGRTLRGVLEDDDEREVEEAARLLRLPMGSIDNLRPWLVSIQLSNVHLDRLGFSQASGVETVLGNEAQRLNKDIRYFETGARQIELFASVPEQSQIAMLVDTAIQIEDDPNFLDRTVADWLSGDVAALAEAIASDGSFGSGPVYDTMLKGRNADWALQIQDLLNNEPGTFFVAVGAAHLTGTDSVLAYLENGGLEVFRE